MLDEIDSSIKLCRTNSFIKLSQLLGPTKLDMTNSFVKLFV